MAVSGTKIKLVEEKEMRRLKVENQYLKRILDNLYKNIIVGEATLQRELKPPEDIKNDQSLVELTTNTGKVTHKFYELETELDYVHRRISQVSSMIAGDEWSEEQTILPERTNKFTTMGRKPRSNPSQTTGQSERSLKLDKDLELVTSAWRDMKEKLRSSNTNVEEMKIHEKDCAAKISSLEAQVNQMRQDNDKLITRLSAIGAVWLTDNNPNITDLSDDNRPEKLLEQFSEIYDNEWTDGFEYLTTVEEYSGQSSIQSLLSILQDIYNECLISTRKQRKKLKHAMCTYLGLSSEFQKNDELVLKETEKKLTDYRGKRPDLCLASIRKVIGQTLLKNGYGKNVYDALDKYIQGCIRVCWFMCAKKPQMHLYFGQNIVNKGRRHFDDSRFVSYTRTGKYVKYFVWPAVFLYEDGPIMKKGVAQGGKKSKTRKRKSKNRVGKMVHDHDESMTKPTIKET